MKMTIRPPTIAWSRLSERAGGRATVIATVCALLAIATLIEIRHDLAQNRAFAGPADLSFYFTLAKKIFHGESLTIDYVWHF